MAKLPMYTQRYQQGTRRAAGEDMGAAEGRAQAQLGGAMMQASEQFAQIEVRRRNREDTINRVRAINEYRQLAEQEATRTSTEDDLTSTDVPKNYGAFLNSELGRIVSEHGGSSASKAELETQLLNIQGAYSRDMYKQSTAAQFKAMDTHIADFIRRSADAVGDSPSTLNEYFAMLDAEIELLAPALTPEQEVAYKEMGRAHFISSAAATELARGNYEAVEAMLADPIAESTLDPDTMRQLKTKLIVASREEQIEQAALTNKFNAIERATGVKLTPTQKLQLAGLNPPKEGPKTLAQEVADFETVMGRPATKDEVLQLAGIKSASSEQSTLYGNSLRGKATERVVVGVNAFATDQLGPQGDQIYISDVLEAYGPIKSTDPVTKQPIMIPGKVAPPAVMEALRMRGMAHILDATTAEEVATTVNTEYGDGTWPDPETITGGFDAAMMLSGPVGQAELMIEGMPFIGGKFGPQDVTKAKADLMKIQSFAVNALQQNPQYAEGERKQLLQDLEIIPGIWSNPENAATKMIALDEALESRYKIAMKMAEDRSLAPLDRQAARRTAAIVDHTRTLLALPPLVESAEEAKKLPPGTRFRTPDNRIMRVPSSGGEQ